MEPKKSDKANLENKRTIFFRIGLILSLSLILLAFDWTSNNFVEQDLAWGGPGEDVEELIPITRPDEKITPPKPKVNIILEIKPNDVILPEDDIFIDTETDETDSVDQIEVYFEPVDEEEVIPTLNIYELQQQPEFPGGEEELFRFIKRNAHYPEIAREIGLQGKVHVSFIIDEKGIVTHVEVERCTDEILCVEAIKVVKMMPKWKPGKQMGKAVRTVHHLPIDFKLE